jgi:hypothetical protein
MMAIMQSQMQNLPPEQQKMFNQLMGDQSATSTLSYEPAGSSTINTWATSGFPVLEDGNKIGEIHIAAYDVLSLESSQFYPLKSFVNFFQASFSEMLKGIQMNSAMGFLNMSSDEFSLFEKGVPVKFEQWKNNKRTSVSTIQSIETNQDLSNLFGIPEGYTKKSLEELMQSALTGR